MKVLLVLLGLCFIITLFLAIIAVSIGICVCLDVDTTVIKEWIERKLK